MGRGSSEPPEIITEEFARLRVAAALKELRDVQLRPGSTRTISQKEILALGRETVSAHALSTWINAKALPQRDKLDALGGLFEGVRDRWERNHEGTGAELPSILWRQNVAALKNTVIGARKAAQRQAAEMRKAKARKSGQPRELAYPGLAPYGPAMTRWFCGRDDDIARMITRLDRTYSADSPTPIPLVAVSGTGKSSYLAAGVGPTLRSKGLPTAPHVKTWEIVAITPGIDPVANLVRAIPTLRDAAEAPTLDRAAIHTALSDSAAPGVLLFVDQAEELFQSEIPAAQRARFGELLAALAAASSPGAPPCALVIVAMRADFFHRLGDIPALRAARHEVEYLDHLTEAQLRAVITEPARRAGFRVAEDLVTQILADAQIATRGSDDGQLPLIAHVLHLMNRANKFNLKYYSQMGGLDGAVSKTADRAWETVSSEGLTSTATDLLLRLVHVGSEPAKDTRRRVLRTDLLTGPHAAEVGRALEILSGRNARLITIAEGRNGSPDAEVTIVHESLLRLWDRLRKALDHERDDLRAHHKIGDRARDWDGAGRRRDDLDRGGRLREAHRILTRWPAESDLTTLFIQESDRNARRSQRLRTASVVFFCALIVLLSGAVYQVSRTNNDLVFADVVRAADGLHDQDPSLAAQLYLYGYRLRPTPELYTDLLSTQSTPLASPLYPDHGPVRSMVFTPDGAAAIVGSADGTVQLWDVRNRSAMHPWGPPLPGTGQDTKSVAVTPDGRTVIAGDASGTVRMWDVSNLSRPLSLIPARRATAERHHALFSGVLSLAVTPDGRTLLLGGSDGSIHRWDISNPHDPQEREAPLEGHGAVTSLAVSNDGHTLAAGRTDHMLSLLDLRDSSRLALIAPPMPAGDKAIYTLAFSPSGPVLATAGADGLVRLWGTADPRHLTPLGAPLPGATNNAVYGLAFSADGKMLASAGADNRVRLWNVSNADDTHLMGSPLGGHTRGVSAVAFSPNDQTLISGSTDSSVRVWSLPRELVGHNAPVSDVALTTDGDTAVSVSQDGTAQTWDISGGSAAPLGAPTVVDPAGVIAVAVSPDASTMATGSVSGIVQLWSLRDRATPISLGPPLTGAGKPIYGLSFSADGKMLASAGADNVVDLWTVGDNGGLAAGAFSPDGRKHSPLPVPDGVGAVRFGPSGRILAAGSPGNTVNLWDVSDPSRPEQLGHTATHTAFVKSIAVSPDGTTLAVGSADHTVRLFDVHDPRHPQAWGRAPVMHGNSVTSLDFSADGKKLISGDDAGLIVVWDVSNHNKLNPIGKPFLLGSGAVRAVVASLRRDLVVSGGRDSLVTVWSTDVQQSIRRICQATPNTLTSKVWSTYVPSTDYDPPCP